VVDDNKIAEATKIARYKSERDRFVALAFCWADALFELDTYRKVIFATGSTEPLTGRRSPELIGMHLNDLIAQDDQLLVSQLATAASMKGRIDNVTVRLQGPGGTEIPALLAGYCLEDLDGHYFLAFRKAPLAAGKGATEEVSRDTDSGLYDSSTFTNVVKKRLQSPRPGDGESRMTLIELEGFEALQGRLDKEAEQNLLTTVGATLRANSEGGDSAARLADNRFGLVHSTDLDVTGLQEQIAEISRTLDPDKKGVEVGTATVEMEEGETSPEDLANGLVYAINKFRTSESGDFTIEHLASNLSTLVSEASDTVNAFKKIVGQGDFDVVFMPIVEIESGKVHHYEALVRFHKDGSGKSPYETITFAEETGLIAEFDLAMVKKVIGCLTDFPKDAKVGVAVNISGSSMGSKRYLAGLLELLQLYPWTKDQLLFEITESTRLDDLDAANAFIQNLRAGGYEVCLDDFGAGAANFEYLSILDIDVVKFDGPVVKNAFKAKKGRAFLRALVNLCNDLEVETIAEMIDSKEMLNFVRDCGVHYVQGYLVGKPSAEIEGVVGNKRSGK